MPRRTERAFQTSREVAYREQRREQREVTAREVYEQRETNPTYDWNFARSNYLRGGLRAAAVFIGLLACKVWDDLYDDHLADGFWETVDGPSTGSLFLVFFLTTSVLWFFISVLYRMDKKR